jgi:AhpC/TSA family
LRAPHDFGRTFVHCHGEPVGRPSLLAVTAYLRIDHDMLEEGKPAPDFTAPTDSGNSLTLSALRGKPVVLYFYPKDDTPG